MSTESLEDINNRNAQTPAVQPDSIICPLCLKTSYHPGDISHQYCANCDKFIRDAMANIDSMAVIRNYDGTNQITVRGGYTWS